MRIWRKAFAGAGLLCVAGLASPAHAVQYVSAVPLAKVVNTPVGSVAGGPTQVPVITWGGDIATVHANGNAVATAPGSIFGKLGLKLQLVREDVFSKQVEAYLAGRSPYLRGTLGMINLALDTVSRDPRTKPIVIYQLTWSAGGDALVVKSGIRSVRDLRGKSIALQAYGPHIDYLTKILADAGLSTQDVTIKWVPDLTGTKNTPPAALREKEVDAALVIIPDAMALTSNGTVGSGAEDSVKGARILLSTKTANRIIAAVYAVRSDYLQSNRDAVEKFVRGLIEGEASLRQLAVNKSAQAAEYKTLMSGAAAVLLDSAQAVADTEGMYGDAEFVRTSGNVAFFTDRRNPRRMEQLNAEIQQAFIGLGLLSNRTPLTAQPWDYQRLGAAAGGTVAAAETTRHRDRDVHLREALKSADAMAPCVLWIDESEKGVATNDNNADGGESRRILGGLLTWMAERRSRVFIVATSNSIEALPPELVRKGRLDEIFFVDLPDKASREEVFRIHLARRSQDPAGFDLVQLAQRTEGFSGAEIEQSVVAALYEARAKQCALADSHLLDEIARTKPLSVVMGERIAYLRAWATDRTVKAD